MPSYYEDEKWLTKPEDIKSYFEEAAYDELDCGQGYYADEGSSFVKIGNKFYLVKYTAEIGSAKQDRGDRLYWVEKIETVTYEEIDKSVVIDHINAGIQSKIDKLSIQIAELENLFVNDIK